MRSVRIVSALLEVVTLVVITVFFAVVFMTVQNVARDNYIRAQRFEIDRIDKVIETLIDGHTQDLEKFVRVAESAGTIAMMHKFSDLYFVDNDRRVARILVKGGRSLIFQGFDVRASALGGFLDWASPGEIVRSSMIRAFENGELSMYLVYHDARGWLVGRIGLSALRDDLEHIAASNGSIIVFATNDGYILSSTLSSLPLQMLPAETKGVMSIGEEEYAFFRKNIAAMDNDLVIFSPMAAVSGLMNRIRLIAYIAMGTLMLMVLLKIGWQTVLIIRPLANFSALVSGWKPDGGLPPFPEKFYSSGRSASSITRSGIRRES